MEPELVPQEVTRTLRGLKHLYYKEKLRVEFRLEKETLL